jgi:hypothetical protein
VRAAFSKNMTLLDLAQWGGGLDLNYAIDTTFNPPIFRVSGATPTATRRSIRGVRPTMNCRSNTT